MCLDVAGVLLTSFKLKKLQFDVAMYIAEHVYHSIQHKQRERDRERGREKKRLVLNVALGHATQQFLTITQKQWHMLIKFVLSCKIIIKQNM